MKTINDLESVKVGFPPIEETKPQPSTAQKQTRIRTNTNKQMNSCNDPKKTKIYKHYCPCSQGNSKQSYSTHSSSQWNS